MSKRLLVGAVGAVLLIGLAGGVSADGLRGGQVENGATLPPVGSSSVIEVLQKGFVVSQGIGCQGTAGETGGPNDVAEGLTLAMNVPPVDLKTFTYLVVTPGLPGFITASSFAAWKDTGGIGPGATICTGPPIPFTGAGVGIPTTHVVPMLGCKILPGDTSAGHFYAGISQGGVGGMRWGYQDAGIGTPPPVLGDSWIRAPVCGASSWLNLSNAAIPGAWVFRVTADAQGPIEVEEFSWGEIKARYQ